MGYVPPLQNGMVRWNGVLNSLQGYKVAPKLRQIITNQHGVIFQDTEVSVKKTVMSSNDLRQSCSNSTAVFAETNNMFVTARLLFKLLLNSSFHLTINRDSTSTGVFKHVCTFLSLHRAF